MERRVAVRVGVNGFGRIGMLFTKAAMDRGDIEVVAANDLMPFDSLANLFKHDSTHGIWPEDVSFDDGSITDFVARISGEASADDVNAAFQSAADGELSDILEYAEAPLVSSDIVGNKASCIFDSQLTMSNGGTVKVLGWYDNEWGYSNRTCDLAAYMGEKL